MAVQPSAGQIGADSGSGGDAGRTVAKTAGKEEFPQVTFPLLSTSPCCSLDG